MSRIRYKDEKGDIHEIEGRLSSGTTDLNGEEIFDGDRVNVWVPELEDRKVKGTVHFIVDEDHPSWLIELDEEYEHTHYFPEKHNIPFYKTKWHYLEGNDVVLLRDEDE